MRDAMVVYKLGRHDQGKTWKVELIILLPVIGGLIVGPVVCCLAPEARGDGIPSVMEALQRRGGQIRKRVGFIIICAYRP